MSTPSISGAHPTGSTPETNGSHGSTESSTPAPPSSAPTPDGEASAQLSRLGKLKAKMSGAAKRTGEGIAKIESPLGSTASGGYIGWGANNTASSGSGLASAAGDMSEGTKVVAEVTGALGAVPQALDIVATAVGTAHKGFKLANSAEKARTTEKGTLEGDEARRTLAQDKGNLQRALPGAARDVGLGSLNMTSRMDAVAHPGESLYGKAPGPVHADGGLAIASGAMYLSTGVLQSRAVNRKVQRTHAFGTALNHPASEREDTASPAMQRLDDLHANGSIDANVYSILRQRSDAEVTRFTRNFDALGTDGQRRLNSALHFSGEQVKFNVLNFSRKTNLNTASTRRAIREDVIDAFIAAEPAQAAPGHADALFKELGAVRKESRGKRIGPDLSTLDAHFARHGLQKSEFDNNTLAAIAKCGNPDAFLARYRGLSTADRARVRDTMHFGTWRFWKSDATLPTTKYQRGDIRQALARHFVDGDSIARLETLKTRYNSKVVPLKPSGTTPQTATPPEMLKHHLNAYQALNLDNLKEEKRHAKVLVTYGAVNMAAGVAELAVNPVAAATAGQMSASRAALSPVYLIYAGRRGIVSYITQKNARPIDAKMHEEALLHAMPAVRERIGSGAASTQRLQHRDMFLRTELKLGDGDIKKLDALERAGNHAGAREFLTSKNPANNTLVALRVLAEERGGVGSDYHRDQARQLIDNEAHAHDSAALRAIGDGTNPDESWAALKTHFLDEAAYHPATGIGTLAAQLSAGTAHGDPGFDSSAFNGRPANEIADHLQTRFAQDNPPFAIRQFVAGWRDGGADSAGAAQARNMLRDMRFTENDIAGLEQMSRKDACSWLESHLFGENVRRRFSTVTLDQAGRNRAADVAERVQPQRANAQEPLTWRKDFEQAGTEVIDNPGTPGLDSMLYALHQNLSGKSDSASSTRNTQVMAARTQVIRRLRAQHAEAGGDAASPLHIDVAQHAPTIVEVAAQVYGKPGAAVKLVDATGARRPARVGGNAAGTTPLAGVVCYDSQSKRTFALHGGKPVSELPPLTRVSSNASSSSSSSATPSTVSSVTSSTVSSVSSSAPSSASSAFRPLKPIRATGGSLGVDFNSDDWMNALPETTTPATSKHASSSASSTISSVSSLSASSSGSSDPDAASQPRDPQIRNALANLVAHQAPATPITPWRALPLSTRAHYHSQHEYEQEATMLATDFRPTRESLDRSGFNVVGNSGNLNNCLIISLVQHATGDYSHAHRDQVSHYRDQLVGEGLIRDYEPMTFNGAAATRLVQLINENPQTAQPLRVFGVTQVAGATHVDHIGAGAHTQNMREVMVWDQAGHFEAVVPKNAATQ